MMKVIEVVVEPEALPVMLIPVEPEPQRTSSSPDAKYHLGCDAVLRDDVYSDDTGLSNVEKWHQAQSIFGEAENIFAELSYEEVFEGDDPYRAQAAAFVADLRAQHYLAKIREDRTNMYLHSLFVCQATWRTRFFERANLENISQMMRDARLI